MKRTIAALAVSGTLALGITAPAEANYGVFNYAEFQNVCTDSSSFTVGCARASYQAEVEGDGGRGCSCGGHAVDTWTSGGRAWKRVSYDNTETGTTASVLIDYKKLDSGKWAVGGKIWNPGGQYIN